MIPIAYSVGSLTTRKTTTATAVIGIALVVFVLAGSMMLSAGVKRALGNTGRSDAAIVIRKGSDAELSSNFDLSSVGLILDGPEVRRGEKGTPLGVGEVVVVVAIEKIGSDGGVSNVNVRGVPDTAYDVRRSVRIVEGRPAKPGTDEAVVGAKIRGRFKGCQLGEKLEMRKNRTLQIVGVFADDGSSYESEVWADVDTVRTAFGRDTVVSSVRAALVSEDAFPAFKDRIERDKRLGLEAQRETEYYDKQSQGLSMFLGVLGGLVAVFFAAGAMMGAMITMYASVANRRREIGTLRAIGFSRRSVLFAFVLEAILISLAGGVVGCIASLALGMVKFSMMNFATWSELVFTFHPTPTIIVVSMICSGIMGLLGGFLPALQAAMLKPVEAMRGE